MNRDLTDEFAALLAGASWDVAMLQECPPRWADLLAKRCGAESHRALTSRNSLAPIRRALSRFNPDLVASNEGGSNLTLVRGGRVAERRKLAVSPGPDPERRVLAFTRLESGVCVANLHASAGAALQARAESELRLAAERSLEWAGGRGLILGGDLNVRPRRSEIYLELAESFGLTGPTAGDSLDHLLVHGLETVEAPSAWPSERREVAGPGGLRLRLSDHAPVSAVFRAHEE